MNNLPRIIHLSTTDAKFRAALQTDPRAALAERGLEANAEELAALVELRSLVVIPPQKLPDLLNAIPAGIWSFASSVPAPAT